MEGVRAPMYLLALAFSAQRIADCSLNIVVPPIPHQSRRLRDSRLFTPARESDETPMDIHIETW
jgi:hypothetical protein